jgi:hypothetical protein
LKADKQPETSWDSETTSYVSPEKASRLLPGDPGGLIQYGNPGPLGQVTVKGSADNLEPE